MDASSVILGLCAARRPPSAFESAFRTTDSLASTTSTSLPGQLECVKGHLLQLSRLSCSQGRVHTRSCARCGVAIPRSHGRFKCCEGAETECRKYEVCVSCMQKKHALEAPEELVVVLEPEPEQESLLPEAPVESDRTLIESCAAVAPDQPEIADGMLAKIESRVGGEFASIATLASDLVDEAVSGRAQEPSENSDILVTDVSAATVPEEPERSESRFDLPLGFYTIAKPAAVGKFQSLSDEIVATLEVGRTVEVLEVAHLAHEDRVRARIRDPAGYISVQCGQGELVWAVPRSDPELHQAIGEYIVRKHAAVNEALSVTGKVVAVLKEDTSVEVLEILQSPAEDRLRARIADPPGYISLQVLSDPDLTWATPALPLFSELRPSVGRFTITSTTSVSNSIVDGRTLALLEPGTQVEVLRILHCSHERRIRALLREPRGYITLRKTDDVAEPFSWAAPCLEVQTRRSRLTHSATMSTASRTSVVLGR